VSDQALRLVGIRKEFPGVVANDGVTLDVRRGEVHALLGENGAGKSTLMKILYGVQKPDDGEILIDGEPRAFRSPSDAIAVGIGMVFQHFMLADNLTALENVVLGAEKLHGIGDDASREFSAISDRYGFGLRPDVLVERLGVADRQRLEILKVLYRGAHVIILDELGLAVPLDAGDAEHLAPVDVERDVGEQVPAELVGQGHVSQ
jgi:simple sugar transport system ATP-binding protein